MSGGLAKVIVKRRGHEEKYDDHKLYASVYSACLAVMVPTGEAELVADKVVSDVDGWLKDKEEVTSSDLHRIAAKNLEVYNKDAAYIYKTHRIVS